ncbi:alternative oxidase, mitochondrial-like [Lytechinus variegatus]|uniref:alternative oxidase, mitochondrial-like n=1 Tax=Lytechinus variegatus TaxID=7654 RepID=UPI001BB1B78E|nr:alternative oxidase, mitochondrial-like [Lytechinus variegatus]
MILGSVSSKFSAQILPRTVTSVCGPHWWSGGGGLATAGVTNTGERKAGHRLSNIVSENRPARFSIFSCNISPFNHAESYSLVKACQQCHSISPVQVNRYTTQSPGADGEVKSNPSPHFKTRKNLAEKSGKASTEDIQAKDVRPGSHDYLMPHPIWSEEELDAVQITHNPPKEKVDKAAYWACKALRTNFDLFSGFTWGKRTERKWIYRIIFLETVAGVPGMVAAMSRHLRSLRRMQRDHGWIHTLLEEAENERMHLMTALEIKQPSMFFRLMVLGAQGIFVNMFFISYLISPKFCHRFVGYLEEEAVITYTKLLKDLREDALPKWKDKIAPEISINYWKLRPDADYIDLFRAIRADEAHHREVNHTLSDIKPDEPNPYGPGK